MKKFKPIIGKLLMCIAFMGLVAGTFNTSKGATFISMPNYKPGSKNDGYHAILWELKNNYSYDLEKDVASLCHQGAISQEYTIKFLEEGFLTDWIDEFKAAGDLPADFPMEDTEKKADTSKEKEETKTDTSNKKEDTSSGTSDKTASSSNTNKNNSSKEESNSSSNKTDSTSSSNKNNGNTSTTNSSNSSSNKNNNSSSSNKTSNTTTSSSNTNIAEKEEHMHQYLGKTVKEATCTKAGKIVYTCECGDSYEEKTEKLGHAYMEQETTGSCPTGVTFIFICDNCGKEKLEEYEPMEHSYEVTEQINATCTEDGFVTSTCIMCNDVITETIPAKGHNGIEQTVENASLFKAGLKQTVCTECGEVVAEEEIPAKSPVGLVAIGIVAVAGGVIVVRRRKKS